MVPYRLMYRLGLAPWERRDVAAFWDAALDESNGPHRGRALDIGCGRGRDAVHLALRGWQVTAIDLVSDALAKARERAAAEGAQVEWVAGDVSRIGALGLEPGYTLLYDFGCIHGLSDSDRAGAGVGITELAAPGATLLMVAFKSARRLLLPRGMDRDELVGLLEPGWTLVAADLVDQTDMPPPVRRAEPTLYRLERASGRAS